MSWQWVFDNAESLSINKRPIVSQTITRDQRVRSVSRGGDVWRFTIKMPTGMRWSDRPGTVRYYAEWIDTNNLLTPQTITLASDKFDWLIGYRGDATSPDSMTWKYTSTQAASDRTKFELGNMPGSVGTVLFRTGDVIQPFGGKVYTVSDIVVKGSSPAQLVKVNRPILETPSNTAVTLKVANNVSWNVQCVQCPTWTIIERDIVAWNGEFVFYEVL